MYFYNWGISKGNKVGWPDNRRESALQVKFCEREKIAAGRGEGGRQLSELNRVELRVLVTKSRRFCIHNYKWTDFKQKIFLIPLNSLHNPS